MKLKINYLNTVNYSLIMKGVEETSFKYSNSYRKIHPNDQSVYKTLTKVDQLITLANGKRKANDSDKNILFPLLNLDDHKADSNYLIDEYQTKQYIRLTTIGELTTFLKTKKGYSRLIKQIDQGEDGLDFNKYILKAKSKQAAYLRDSKLLIVILNFHLLKRHDQFDPTRWDSTSLIEVMKTTINDIFGYTPITDPEIIKKIASDYSNSKAEALRKEINEEKNKEDKLLSSLCATFEQLTSLNKL